MAPKLVLQALVLTRCMLGSHVPRLRAFLLIGTLASGAHGANPLFSLPTDRRLGALELAPSVLDVDLLNRRDQKATLNTIKRRACFVFEGDVGYEELTAGWLMGTARARDKSGEKDGVGGGSMHLRGGATSSADAAPSHEEGSDEEMDVDSDGVPHLHTDETDEKVSHGRNNSRERAPQQLRGIAYGPGICRRAHRGAQQMQLLSTARVGPVLRSTGGLSEIARARAHTHTRRQRRPFES
jgi:hypothetical protein